MSLESGKLIERRSFTPIPLTQEIIDRVEEIGKQDKKNVKYLEN